MSFLDRLRERVFDFYNPGAISVGCNFFYDREWRDNADSGALIPCAVSLVGEISPELLSARQYLAYRSWRNEITERVLDERCNHEMEEYLPPEEEEDSSPKPKVKNIYRFPGVEKPN